MVLLLIILINKCRKTSCKGKYILNGVILILSCGERGLFGENKGQELSEHRMMPSWIPCFNAVFFFSIIYEHCMLLFASWSTIVEYVPICSTVISVASLINFYGQAN